MIPDDDALADVEGIDAADGRVSSQRRRQRPISANGTTTPAMLPPRLGFASAGAGGQ